MVNAGVFEVESRKRISARMGDGAKKNAVMKN